MGDAPPPPARPKPVDYVCETRGENTVTRDAWAEWDADAQEWTLGATFDYAYYHDCDGETRLVEVDLETRQPTGG